jgi:hypothetical protein
MMMNDEGHQILSSAVVVPDVDNACGTTIDRQSTPSFDELYNAWVDNDKNVNQKAATVIQNDRYDMNRTMEGSTYESPSDISHDIDIDHDDPEDGKVVGTIMAVEDDYYYDKVIRSRCLLVIVMLTIFIGAVVALSVGVGLSIRMTSNPISDAYNGMEQEKTDNSLFEADNAELVEKVDPVVSVNNGVSAGNTSSTHSVDPINTIVESSPTVPTTSPVMILSDVVISELSDIFSTTEEVSTTLSDVVISELSDIFSMTEEVSTTNLTDWYHGSTTTITRKRDNGTIALLVPPDAKVDDHLFLFLSRTDDYLPLQLDQWTSVAQCFKSSNEQAVCLTASDCTKQEDDYCKTFTKGRGRDLGTAVYFHKLTPNDRNDDGVVNNMWRNWTIDIRGNNTAWAIINAIAGVNEKQPVLTTAGTSCDKEPGSVFPSVNGKVNDILLLSQSFDDTANIEHFLPPEGTMLLDWIKGDDEVSFGLIMMYIASNLESWLTYLCSM